MVNIIELFFKTSAEKKFFADLKTFNTARWERLADFSGLKIDDDPHHFMTLEVKKRSFFRRWSSIRVVIINIIAIALMYSLILGPGNIFTAVAFFTGMGIIIFSDRKNYDKEIFLRRKELVPLTALKFIELQNDLNQKIEQLTTLVGNIKTGDLAFIKEQLSSDDNLSPWLTIASDDQLQLYWKQVKQSRASRPGMHALFYRTLLGLMYDEVKFLKEFKV